MTEARPPEPRGCRKVKWRFAGVPGTQEVVHLLLAADCAQVGLPTSAIQVREGFRGLVHQIPAQPPCPQLALHAGEEVQHTAVREVPRMLTARLVKELLFQVHIVAPVPALQEDCLVEAGPQATGQEGRHDQQQGDAPADGLEVEEA